MTESDARSVLLLRAFDDTRTPAWSESDAAEAGDAARRTCGESAAFDSWLVARAKWGVAQVARRGAPLSALERASGWPAGVGTVLVLLAFIVGVASDVVGGTHRINILAPPLFALLLWNLAVYVLLIVRGVARERAAGVHGPILRALSGWIARRAAAGVRTPEPALRAAVVAFAADWVRQARSLYAARLVEVLHVAAAALALGALASLYGRGLVLEYRAGWDSTFLTAADVRAVLAFVLGPASSLSGIAIPDVAHVAAVRFAAGAGENAAPWIHLYAITLAWVVVAPRLVLALVAALRVRGLAARFPLQLDDDYSRRLRRAWSGAPLEVRVFPYSYSVATDQRAALRPLLEQHLGARAEPTFADALPLGAEDDLAPWVSTLPARSSAESVASTSTAAPTMSLVALLFALTATPEREHHGAVVRALATQVGRERMLVLVDESGFRRRFAGADLAWRLDQRRQAWQTLLTEDGFEPLFVDLGADAQATTPGAGAPAAQSAGR